MNNAAGYDGIREVLEEAASKETAVTLFVAGMTGNSGPGRRLAAYVPVLNNARVSEQPVTVGLYRPDEDGEILHVRIDSIVAAHHGSRAS